MSKKFSNCRCVHCFQYFEELTSDHVFPVSWFPNTTPENIEKWQMPSCMVCNKKYGKIEEALLIKLGLCISPFSPESFGIPQKVWRAINQNEGKNDRDAKCRKKKKDKIIRELIDPATVPITAILPNFGPSGSLGPNHGLAVFVHKSGLDEIGKKLIRGITWVIDEKIIDSKYEIEIYYLREQEALHLIKLLHAYGKEYSIGPGIRVIRAIAAEDPICGLYSIKIWGRLNMYGIVNRCKKDIKSLRENGEVDADVNIP